LRPERSRLQLERRHDQPARVNRKSD
jgi:hypothetical protein